MLNEQAKAGVRVVRQTLRWSEIEVEPNTYDFSIWDTLVADVAERRMRLLPILFDPPAWRSSAPKTGAKRGVHPPRSNTAFANFAALMTRRYGPNGRFWRDHPDLPQVPIGSWQVWNEPNLPYYWPEGPNATEYAAMLAAVAKGIRRADPDAEIVTAGLPDSIVRGAIPINAFLAGMYVAGARDSFDALAVNGYAGSSRDMLGLLHRARLMMDLFDDEAPIWVTELGWATQGPANRFRVGHSAQARLVSSILGALKRNRRRLNVKGVVYYMWQDAPPYPGFHDFWGLHTGLLDIEGRKKPGFYAFRRAAGGLRYVR